MSNTNSFVRPVSPDDGFDDRTQRSFVSSSIFSGSQRSNGFSQSTHSSNSSLSLNSSLQGFPRPNPYLQHAPPPPAARQVSNSSTVITGNSGSENWETFDDDGSESEPDASEVYYAKLRAAHGKRIAPDDSQPMTLGGKKAKGIRSVSPDEQLVSHNGQMLRASDGEWTDDMEPY